MPPKACDTDILFGTVRLRIRHWRTGDLAQAYKIYGSTEVTRFVPRRRVHGKKDLARILQMDISTYDAHPGYGHFAMERRSDGEVLGALYLRPSGASGHATAGWLLERSVWGNGYATEAGFGLLRHAFEELSVPAVDARFHRGNIPAQRVANMLGMQAKGIVSPHARHARFQITSSDWKRRC